MTAPTAGEDAEARRAAGRVDDMMLNWADLRGDLADAIAEHPWRPVEDHATDTVLCGCGLPFIDTPAWAGHLSGVVEEALWGYEDDGLILTPDARLREALRLADAYPVVVDGESYQEARTENLLAAQTYAAIAQALYARRSPS